MKYLIYIFTISCILHITTVSAQRTVKAPQYSIKGVVVNKTNQAPIPYANIVVYQTNRGTMTDENGNFELGPLSPAIYEIQVSCLGYKSVLSSDIKLFTSNQSVRIELEESVTELAGITVYSSGVYRKVTESPTSLRSIGIKEIEQNAGSNRDISRVLTSLPGVTTPAAAYRNDLFVRGGGPSENRFYLDGIEIPNINHFSTQGASGGPVGIINADLVREVDFYSSAFPISKPNKLSALLDIKLQDGNREKNVVELGVGASEASISAQGPLTARSTYLFSLRQSYLQFVFKALDLPFLPTYTDALVKIKTRFNRRHEVNFIYLAGWDNMKLNTGLDTTGAQGMDDQKAYNAYILGYLPRIQQHAFTYGMQYKYYGSTSTHIFTLSHNYLQNINEKYSNNIALEENRLLKIESEEREAHARYENRMKLGEWGNYSAKILSGAHLDYGHFNMDSYIRNSPASSADTSIAAFSYQSSLSVWKWGLHAGLQLESGDDRLRIFLGLQSEANNYASAMRSLKDQLSPRLSLSFRIFQWGSGETEQSVLWNNAIGRYYQLPAYTTMGYQETTNGISQYVNRDRLSYIGSDQFSSGLEWRKGKLQFSADVFYKSYFNSPLSVNDSIPLACKGDDYGTIGNEAVSSSVDGKSYGLELLARWQDRTYGSFSASYTWSRSSYEGIASAWDFRQIGSVSGVFNLPELGILGKDWSLGMKFRYVGGAPYTPYDEALSSLISVWDVTGRAVLDYSRYNSLRQHDFTQLDVRIDKSFYQRGWMFRFYVDVQNALASSYETPPLYISTGRRNAQDPSRYEMRYLKRVSNTVFPTVGLMFEF